MITKTAKYFGTDGIRGRVGSGHIHPATVMKLGWAVGKVLGDEKGKVLIGKDTRISGYMFESSLEAGLSAAGMDICLLGPMPTPGIAYLTKKMNASAGIVISASHNSFEDNGFKFFDGQGFKLSRDTEREIEQLMESDIQLVEPAMLGKAVRIDDAAAQYAEFCKACVPDGVSFNGLKVVIDCAHGATYHIAPQLFQELGVQVIAIHDQPNGLNINADAGSTHPEQLQERVLAENADVGIAFDGDGDRVIMVDHQGELVDGDELLFIMTKYAVEKNTLQGGVVGTLMSNYGFEQGLQQLGVDFIRAKVGDRYVVEALQEKGWALGGEASGHLVNLGLTTTGDGIISALQVLCAMCDTKCDLQTLAKQMVKMPQVLINVNVEGLDIDLQSQKVQEAISVAQTTLGNQGRVLVRASGTEPVIRVMVEGSNKAAINSVANELSQFIVS